MKGAGPQDADGAPREATVECEALLLAMRALNKRWCTALAPLRRAATTTSAGALGRCWAPHTREVSKQTPISGVPKLLKLPLAVSGASREADLARVR